MVTNQPHLQPIEKQTLAQTAMERLVVFVRSTDFRPGQALPAQHELARQLDVSRPVLREAMQGLASLGVIEIRPGSGCYVRDPHASSDPDSWADSFSHEGAIEVLEARMVVEVELAFLAAIRATDTDFAEMEVILDRIKQAVSRGRPTSHITSDFHQAVARAGHNQVLFRMAQLLTQARLVQGLRVEHALPDVAAHEYESHRFLFTAVSSRDPEQARLAMRQHLEAAHGWEDQVDRLRSALHAENMTIGRPAGR